MAIYYHLTTNLDKDGGYYPRIPEQRASGENGTINRTCVADTVLGCFKAMPGGQYDFPNLVIENMGYFKLFIIDTDELEISPSAIVTPETLVKNKWVHDAVETGEHWILEPFSVPERQQHILKIRNYTDEGDGDYEYKILSVKYDTHILEKDTVIHFDYVDLEAMDKQIKRIYPNIKTKRIEYPKELKALFLKGMNMNEIFRFHRNNASPPYHMMDC